MFKKEKIKIFCAGPTRPQKFWFKEFFDLCGDQSRKSKSPEFQMYTILRIQGESGFSDFPQIQMTEMWP